MTMTMTWYENMGYGAVTTMYDGITDTDDVI